MLPQLYLTPLGSGSPRTPAIRFSAAISAISVRVAVVALRALVDRGEGALDALGAAGVDARAVFRREDLLA